MIFDVASHCDLLSILEHQGGPLVAGSAGTLVAGAVLSGQILAGGVSAGGDTLFLTQGPAELVPLGPAEWAGVVLGGTAAAEAARSLAAAEVMPFGTCPGAFEALLRLADSGPGLATAERSALAYHLLCLLAHPAGEAPSLPSLVAAALGHIQIHYGEVYGIEELADEMQVSKSHLIRQFTSAIGLSPGKYLTKVRIENAKRLLAGTPHSLAVVASLCGFSGANYLCRVFKKQVGCSPATWRRQNTALIPPDAPEWEEALYL